MPSLLASATRCSLCFIYQQFFVMKLAIILCCCYAALASDHPGHNKPFGWGNAIPVHEVEGFLPVKEFFAEYARKNLPVVMRGANKVWPGYENWKTDEYFRKVAPKEPFMVAMDKKRGNPDVVSKYVDFKEFIDIYNTSRRRMVERTPEFIIEDVLIPASLDCPALTEGEVLMGHKIWFGANYTTSVVHKDAADNINCLVYGVKNYTLVSPQEAEHVLFDRPDGLYSTMKVDKVDFDKYPGLDKVQYQITELHGGDCIFVPYKWIHQVRSYGRNIAVNIWWNYWKNNEFDLSTCPDTFEKRSIEEAKFHGWGDFETREEGIQEHMTDLVAMMRKDLSKEKFALLFTIGADVPDADVEFIDPDIYEALVEAFEFGDKDGNGLLNADEIRSLPEERMNKMVKKVKLVFRLTRERAEQLQEEDKEYEKESQFGKKKPKRGKKVLPEEDYEEMMKKEAEAEEEPAQEKDPKDEL